MGNNNQVSFMHIIGLGFAIVSLYFVFQENYSLAFFLAFIAIFISLLSYSKKANHKNDDTV